mmetsp:Transcript_4029/g.7424  ORF Transcript_4029/g.7424 Transcript_4029/m.7424 type:complete len:121 (+) Transcript_4029:424-786(+)
MEGAGPSDDARAVKRIEFLIFCLSPPSNRNRYPRTNLCWCLEVPMVEAGEDKRENGENVSDKANKEEETEEERDKHLKSAKDEFSPYKSELAYLKSQIMLMRKESSLTKLTRSLQDRKLD